MGIKKAKSHCLLPAVIIIEYFNFNHTFMCYLSSASHNGESFWTALAITSLNAGFTSAYSGTICLYFNSIIGLILRFIIIQQIGFIYLPESL